MSDNKPTCPNCGSKRTVKNGRIHNKKSKHQCLDCGRQFIENPTKKVISQETKDLIDKLLLEKISLAGIARVTGVSEPWLQKYVNTKYAEIPQRVEVSDKPKGKLTIECDEAWSFVNDKNNKQWIWLALDEKTREIVGVYIGDRSKESAKKLWESLPPVYPRVFGGKLPPETLDVNAPFVIQIFGLLMKKYSQASGINLWVRRVAKLTTLNDLTIQCGREFLV